MQQTKQIEPISQLINKHPPSPKPFYSEFMALSKKALAKSDLPEENRAKQKEKKVINEEDP